MHFMRPLMGKYIDLDLTHCIHCILNEVMEKLILYDTQTFHGP